MKLAASISIVGVLLLGTSADAQVCPLDDMFEPNDSNSNATLITAPAVSPTLSLTYDGGFIGDMDVFKFTLPAGMEVTVDVTADVTNGPIFASMTGGAPGGSASNFQITTENFTALPIEVFLEFHEFFFTAGCLEYSFVSTLQPSSNPCGSMSDDAFEDNDDCMTATPIGAGTLPGLFVSTLDVDFYRVTVPPGSDAFVQVDYVAGNGDVSLRSLLSPCGFGQGFDPGTGGVALLALTNPGPVATDFDLMVAMDLAAPNQCNTYSLTTTFLPSICLLPEDIFEDNDSCMDRVLLPAGNTRGIFLTEADQDWFEVDVPAGATVDIALTGGLPGPLQSLDLRETCNINSRIDDAFGSGDIQVTGTNQSGSTVTWIIRLWSFGGVSGPSQCNRVDLNVQITRSGAGLIENVCGAGTAPLGCGVCPCGNTPAVTEPVRGCENSTAAGCSLVAFGAPFVSDDELRFETRNGVPGSLAVLLSADNSLPMQGSCPPGSGFPNGMLDGLRCVGGNLKRHGARMADPSGAVGLTNAGWGGADAPPIGLIAQGGFSAGTQRYFHCIYRDFPTLGCGTGTNTSNSVGVSFAP